MKNEKQCLRKKAFVSETEAKLCARRVLDKLRKHQRAYRCPNCKWWHLTTIAARTD